jgi:hypothetical protein
MFMTMQEGLEQPFAALSNTYWLGTNHGEQEKMAPNVPNL